PPFLLTLPATKTPANLRPTTAKPSGTLPLQSSSLKSTQNPIFIKFSPKIRIWKFCSPGLISCHFSSILRMAQHKRPRLYVDTTLTITPVPE
ncbi:hypothetical protein LINGRAHAP2_LOCUS4414, partial [Linum grandiflorum]